METYKEEAARIRRAIQLMNNGGEHWIKGSLKEIVEDGTWGYCIVGGLKEEGLEVWGEDEIVGETIVDVARELYPFDHWVDVPDFNDHERTKWGHVKRVLQNAAKRLERMPREDA